MTVEAWAELVDLITTGAAAKRDPAIAPSLVVYELAGEVSAAERAKLSAAIAALDDAGRRAFPFAAKVK